MPNVREQYGFQIGIMLVSSGFLSNCTLVTPFIYSSDLALPDKKVRFSDDFPTFYEHQSESHRKPRFLNRKVTENVQRYIKTDFRTEKMQSIAFRSCNKLQPKNAKNRNNRFSQTEKIESVAKMKFSPICN